MAMIHHFKQILNNFKQRLNKKMVSDEEQNVAGSDTDVTPPPSPKLSRFLRDVEWFDAITAAATTSIAILTGFYVHYSREQMNAMRGEVYYMRQNFHLTRPWVIVSGSRLSAEPDAEPGTRAPTIKLWFQNSGNTPAIEAVCQGKIFMSDTQLAEFKPESTTALPIGSGQLTKDPGSVTIEAIDDTIRNQSSITEYNAGRLRLYFQGKASFKDSAQHPHWTKVCIYHAHGQRLTEFNACPKGNSMDTALQNLSGEPEINKGTRMY